MLEIRNLSVSYGKNRILKNINLHLQLGESLAIIGESGTGKTTLGKCIMRLLEGARVNGKVVLNGENLLELDQDEMRKVRWNKIAMVFQNIESALNPAYSVLNQITEPMIEIGADKNYAKKRAYHLLKKVGIPNLADSYPHQLSGGEKQRTLIAMALANEPEVLILDEPLASLDSLTKVSLTDLLKENCKERISIVVTHDISTAVKLADKIAVLYGGKIVELTSNRLIVREPRHPYTRGLLRSYPNMTRTKDLQGIKGRLESTESGCPFYPRCTQSIEVCEKVEPELQKTGKRFLACHRGGVIPLLFVKKLSKSFNSFKAVDSVDLTLYEGETLALIGESGAGKTTLAKVILGLLKSNEGNLYLENREVVKRDKEFYKKVQMIFQNPRESLSHRLNVMECVKEPLDIQKIGTKEEKIRKVKKTLAEVQLPFDKEFLHKYPHQLSGGELQRVAIARALILNPKLIIADEPTSSLDASVQAKILKLLNNIQEERGLGILFISHDIALARKISDHIAIMHSGKIVEKGTTEQVIYSSVHPYIRRLLEAAPSLKNHDKLD